MDAERRRRAFGALAAELTDYVADSASVSIDSVSQGQIMTMSVEPRNKDSRPISLIAEQWLVLTVGNNGGRWELDYTEDDIALALDIMRSVVDGRVTERFGLFRSHVTVVLRDGRAISETGYGGCIAFLIPNPGWRTIGPIKRYSPY